MNKGFTVDPAELPAKEVYYIHAAMITPRPIAWVGTVSPEGKANLAPHSYFNGISDDPPMIMFAIEGETDTFRNVDATGEFTVSIVGMELAREMELTATRAPYGENEFTLAGLTQGASSRVRAPYVDEAPAAMECRVDRILKAGRVNHVIFGEVLRYHIKNRVWRDGRINPRLLNPLCRLGGRYAGIANTFKMTRPVWSDASDHGTPLDLVHRADDD